MSGKWIKRENVESPASKYYTDIWDGDGWQINKSFEQHNADRPYLLIDVVMPHDVPASGICGHFSTFEEAAEKAEQEGRPDWAEWINARDREEET